MAQRTTRRRKKMVISYGDDELQQPKIGDIFRFSRSLIHSKYDLLKFGVYMGVSVDYIQHLLVHHQSLPTAGYYLFKWFTDNQYFRTGEDFYKRLYKVSRCCGKGGHFRSVFRTHVTPYSQFLSSRDDDGTLEEYLGHQWRVRPHPEVGKLQEEKALLFFSDHLCKFFCDESGDPLWLAQYLGIVNREHMLSLLESNVLCLQDGKNVLFGGAVDRRLMTYASLLNILWDGGLEKVGAMLRNAFAKRKELHKLYCIVHENFLRDSEMNMLPDKMDVLQRLGLGEGEPFPSFVDNNITTTTTFTVEVPRHEGAAAGLAAAEEGTDEIPLEHLSKILGCDTVTEVQVESSGPKGEAVVTHSAPTVCITTLTDVSGCERSQLLSALSQIPPPPPPSYSPASPPLHEQGPSKEPQPPPYETLTPASSPQPQQQQQQQQQQQPAEAGIKPGRMRVHTRASSSPARLSPFPPE